MAFDEALAERVRDALEKQHGISERKMFGGVCFMLGGRMCLGIAGEDLMVRVGKERYEATLSEPNVRPMDFTGRPLKGMVYVAPAGVKSTAALQKWVDRAVQILQSEGAPGPTTRERTLPARRKAKR